MTFCTWIQHQDTWILLRHIVVSEKESKSALTARVVVVDDIWKAVINYLIGGSLD